MIETQLLVREMLNASLATLDGCIAVIFILYLYEAIWPPMEKAGWYRKIENQGAVALAVLFSGEVVRKFGIVGLLLGERVQQPQIYAAGWGFTTVVTASFIVTVGGLCLIRVFAKDGHWLVFGRKWPYKRVAWLIALFSMMTSAFVVFHFG